MGRALEQVTEDFDRFWIERQESLVRTRHHLDRDEALEAARLLD